MSLGQRLFNANLEVSAANPITRGNTVNSQLSQLSIYAKKEVGITCQQYGLLAWRPDFRQSPNSVYNQVHRHVWDVVVDRLISMQFFAHRRIDHRLLLNMNVRHRQFHHFVFHKMRTNWRRELIQPGYMEERGRDRAYFHRRSNVSDHDNIDIYFIPSCILQLKDARNAWLVAQKTIPVRIQHLCEDPAAHSDDEPVIMNLPNLPIERLEDMVFPLTDEEKAALPQGVAWMDKQVYKVRKKPYRSPRFTKFFCEVDRKVRQEKKLTQR
jgi:hypothetical protein